MSKNKNGNEKTKKIYNVRIVHEKKPFFNRILPVLITFAVSVGIFSLLNYKLFSVEYENFDVLFSVFSEKILEFIQITGFSFLIWLISIVFNEKK